MKRSQLALIVIAVILYTLFWYSWGVNRGIKKNEYAVELAFAAVAQQYKNDIENDTTRYDHYGNEKLQKGYSNHVLPKNARTESLNIKATPNTKGKKLRKRN